MNAVVLHMRSTLFMFFLVISNVARAEDVRLAETDEFVLSVDATLLGAVSGVAALFVAPAEHGHDGDQAVCPTEIGQAAIWSFAAASLIAPLLPDLKVGPVDLEFAGTGIVGKW